MHARRTLGVATALLLSAAPLAAQAKAQGTAKPAPTAAKPAATAATTTAKAADSTKHTEAKTTAKAKSHRRAKSKPAG
jgi:hypothetical protein